MASTRVVLPWSTWATMATLRKLGRESTLVIVAVRVPNHENEEKLSRCGECEGQQVRRRSKPKKKCCRSKPRCKRCPLVLHKVHKAETMGIRGKELDKVYKRARKA